MVEENHQRHLELFFPKERKENTPLDKGNDEREVKELSSSERLVVKGKLETIEVPFN